MLIASSPFKQALETVLKRRMYWPFSNFVKVLVHIPALLASFILDSRKRIRISFMAVPVFFHSSVFLSKNACFSSAVYFLYIYKFS